MTNYLIDPKILMLKNVLFAVFKLLKLVNMLTPSKLVQILNFDAIFKKKKKTCNSKSKI